MSISDYAPPESMGGTKLMESQLLEQMEPAWFRDVELIVGRPRRPPGDARFIVLWQHVDIEQESVAFMKDATVHDAIDRFVFVSHWQATRFITGFAVPAERSVVIRNAIHPFAPHDKPGGPIRVVYTSTPWRGLDILLDAWERLRPTGAELHVFSSCKLYGPRFGENDAQYEHLYRRAQSLPGVTYRGIVPNDRLRDELRAAHVYAYPATVEETSCLSLIEGMAAGLHVVASGLGALPETAAGFGRIYPFVPDREKHVDRFCEELELTLEAASRGPADAAQAIYFNDVYAWRRRLGEWREMLLSLEDRSA